MDVPPLQWHNIIFFYSQDEERKVEEMSEAMSQNVHSRTKLCAINL